MTTTSLIADQMKQAGADFPAARKFLFAGDIGPDGRIVPGTDILADEIAIVRTDDAKVLGVHSPSYHFQPFMEVARIAQEIVELRGSAGEKITNIGLFDGGRKFFINLFMGEMAIDPNGVNDKFISSITGFSSHDASLANLFREGNLRLKCNNMLSAIRAGKYGLGYYIKHTKNMPERVVHATAALTQHEDALHQYVAECEAMQQIQMGLDRVDALVNAVWPVNEDSKRSVTISTARRETIVQLFEGPTCAGKLGRTGWAAYNAVTEYIDHHRPDSTVEERALATLTPNSWAEAKKRQAGQRVLALVA